MPASVPAEPTGHDTGVTGDVRWPGRLVADPSLQISEGGKVLIGGSPLKVVRFATPISLDRVRSPQVVDRLVDTGMAHPDPPRGPWSPADVTVVIPVYGHVTAVAETLAALARTEETPKRIIVVDDGSAEPDAIAATVALAGNPTVSLVRRERNRGPAAARNTGLEKVATPLVAFVDAGCVPRPGWLRPLLAHFADPKVALVAPRVTADPERWTDPPRSAALPAAPAPGRDLRRRIEDHVRRAIARYEVSRSSLDQGPYPARVAPGTRVAYVPSACIVADADALREIGGFDEDLQVGEDVDLVWRLLPERRVRYVPGPGATHDVRTRPSSFLARRFAYGTSAAPLAVRHPRGPVPVRVSPWSAAAWSAVALGHPVVGVGIGATSTALLVRKLDGLRDPTKVAMRLAGRGNLAAGGLLANALRRAWWPLALGAALVGPRSVRRCVAAAFVLPPLVTWRPGTRLDPISWVVLSTADDLAYGAGVWAGSLRERTIRPLRPDFGAGRVR